MHVTSNLLYGKTKKYMPNEKKIKKSLTLVERLLVSEECTICRKKKRGQGKTGDLVLTKCVTKASPKTLIDYSKTEVQIEIHFVVLSPLDLIARKYQCHRCCRNVASVHETSFKNNENDLREECFCDIVQFVMNYITVEGNILKLSDLMANYKDVQNKKKSLRNLLESVTGSYISACDK